MVRLDEHIDGLRNYRGLAYSRGIEKPTAHLLIEPALTTAFFTVPFARFLFFPFDRVVHASTASLVTKPLVRSTLPLLRNTPPSAILPVLGASSSVAILSLTINEVCQLKFGVSWKKLRYDNRFDNTSQFASRALASGAISGFLTALILYPLELNKRVLMLDESKRKLFTGLINCTQERFVSGGLGASYRGLTVSLFSSTIYRGLLYGGYEWVKLILSPGSEASTLNERMMSAVAASAMALAICHPFETMRLAIAAETYGSGAHTWMKTSVWKVLGEHLRRPLNLFRGIHLMPIKCIPVSAALIFYDQVFSISTKSWSEQNLGHLRKREK